MTEDLPAPSDRNFLFYDTEDGTTRVQLLVDGQTVWMPQKAIAELFETSVANINTHIRNILGDSEVEADSCLLYTSPSPRDLSTSRMPSSA